MIGLVLLGAGAVLLTAGLLTPRYTDVAAYEAALEVLGRQHAIGVIAQDPAINAFYDLQDRFGTRRWFYLDLGWSLAVWGALAVSVSLLRVSGLRLTTREPAVVLPLTATAIGLFFIGLAAGPILLLRREQLPMWADTIGIPMFGGIILAAVMAPLLAMFVLPPLYAGREARGLMESGRGLIVTVLVTLLYLPPLAGAVFLLAGAVEPGGSIMTFSAWLMIWLLLNARSHWLGMKATSL